jgi:hypothetical protein
MEIVRDFLSALQGRGKIVNTFHGGSPALARYEDDENFNDTYTYA